MRADKSWTASTNGRPPGKLAFAYSASFGERSTKGESKTNSDAASDSSSSLFASDVSAFLAASHDISGAAPGDFDSTSTTLVDATVSCSWLRNTENVVTSFPK